jgi:hypothetical protein
MAKICMKGYNLLKRKFISMKFVTCFGWLTEPKYSNFCDFGRRMYEYLYPCTHVNKVLGEEEQVHC